MNQQLQKMREQVYTIIFEADTRAGRAFDLGLIFFILLSVVLVMLDSIPGTPEQWGVWLLAGEWLITVLFTIEYLLRLAVARRPARYAGSFYGVVDLLSILPTYLGIFLPGMHFLTTVRILRILRIFRILKLVRYMAEAGALMRALRDSGRKIAVFYQYDAYGFDGLTGTELALKGFGLAPVASGSYTRGTLDVQEGLNKIMASGAEAVVMIGTYDPCATFIRMAHERGYQPVFYLVSFVGADELARRIEALQEVTVLMSQVVPPPDRKDPSPLLTGEVGYITLLKRYYPEDQPNFVGLEGFINARVLVEGLRRAGPDLTREGFITAIESIRDLSLGQDITISFSPTDHQGLDRVYFTRLEKGLFSLVRDWADLQGRSSQPK